MKIAIATDSHSLRYIALLMNKLERIPGVEIVLVNCKAEAKRVGVNADTLLMPIELKESYRIPAQIEKSYKTFTPHHAKPWKNKRYF